VINYRDGWAPILPWALAVVGLALPMIGSSFIGWPFAVGWLVLLALVWWLRPLAGLDRTGHIASGIAALLALGLLSTIGGLYLMPAVVAWLVLVARRGGQEPRRTP
jgi:hypothetical protein